MAFRIAPLRIPNMTVDQGNVGGLVANIGQQFLGNFDAARKDAKEEAATNALIGAFDQSQGIKAPLLGGSVAPATAPQGAMAPAQAAMKPMSSSEYGDIFARKEAELGLPPGYLQRTAAVESSMNPNAKNPNSSAGGLFQFIDSTAKQYGLTNKFDPVAATDAAARLAADNKKILTSALGREPTAGELYLAHQQGAGGAAKMLANPDAPAEAVVGAEAARLNGGAGLTAGQFAQKWISKIDGGERPVQMAQAAPSGAAPMADVPASGGSPTGFTIPGQPAASQTIGQPATAQNTNSSMVRALLSNPSTRAAGLQLWQQMATGKSYGFQMIGDQLYRTNANTGTAELVPGITNPKATLDQRKAELDIQKAEKEISGTLTPEQEAQKIRLAQASRTQINNTIGGAEKAQDQIIGKAYGEQFVDLQKSARNAIDTNNRIKVMETLIENPNFYSGAGVNLVTQLKKIGAKLGIDENAATPNEAFASLSNRLVLDGLGGSLGTAISNGDRDFIQATAPALSNTPAGNKEILFLAKKVAERQQTVAKMARDYAKTNGGRLDAGFDEALAGFAEANPLLGEADLKRIAGASGGAPAAPPPPAAAPAPKPGATMDGYRFKGGDPAKPESWVKVN